MKLFTPNSYPQHCSVILKEGNFVGWWEGFIEAVEEDIWLDEEEEDEDEDVVMPVPIPLLGPLLLLGTVIPALLLNGSYTNASPIHWFSYISEWLLKNTLIFPLLTCVDFIL